MKVNLLVTDKEFMGNSGDEHFEFSLVHAQGFGVMGQRVDVALDAFCEALLHDSGFDLKITVTDEIKNFLNL